MKIAVAQISCSLGDPEANLSKVHDFSRRAKDVSAELIVFPEMTDTGYSMSVIQKHADEWNSGFVPGLREIASQLRSRSLVASPNAMDHQSTIPKFWLVRRATLSRGIAKLISMQSLP